MRARVEDDVMAFAQSKFALLSGQVHLCSRLRKCVPSPVPFMAPMRARERFDQVRMMNLAHHPIKEIMHQSHA